MNMRSLIPAAVFLTPLLVLTASCDAGSAPGVTEAAPDVQANLRARGKPTVHRMSVDLSFSGPAGFFCDFAVDAHVVGQDVFQQWVSGDEVLFKSETNVYVTFTNPSTGAAVTNHQTNSSEFLIVQGELVKITDNGGTFRVVIPGEGLVVQLVGHTVVTFDLSVVPPIVTFDFNGRAVGAGICDLID